MTDLKPRQLTLAELCEAIADNRLPHTIEDGSYHVRQSDLLRLARTAKPRPQEPAPAVSLPVFYEHASLSR